jgi:hypothetical protein
VGEVALFPKGLVHFQQNLGCKSLRFLAALSSEGMLNYILNEYQNI